MQTDRELQVLILRTMWNLNNGTDVVSDDEVHFERKNWKQKTKTLPRTEKAGLTKNR